MKYFFLFALTLSGYFLHAQEIRHLTGFVQSEKAEPLEQVLIRVQGSENQTLSSKDGFYSLQLNSKKAVVSYSKAGYRSVTLPIDLSSGNTRQNVTLFPDSVILDEVQIRANARNKANAISVNAALKKVLPSISGNFESFLKTLPGVSANNELSSQYSVRGGNFDENLVYINDVEIYRPLLVRNGQQEGLSFINPELATQVAFSAGGFDARFGDKLSSVLDVRYLKPDSMNLNLSSGFLGHSATFKLPGKEQYLVAGIRFKNNQNLLNKQDVRGNYRPDFSDYQVFYSGKLSRKLHYSALAGYNLSSFNLEPDSRETQFGNLNETLRFQVDYQGKESDRYESAMGALTMLYKPSERLNLKWIHSVFRITEQEKFDIEGHYVFDNGSSQKNRGTQLDYAHNQLQENIYSSEIRAYQQNSHSFFESGLRFQIEQLEDKIFEYSLFDSTGASLSNYRGTLVNAQNELINSHISGFFQNSFDLSSKISLTAGLRANYSFFTREFLLSPRMSAIYSSSEQDFFLRFSAGFYHQPPFYREFRRLDGSLNPQVRSQRSFHVIAAADRGFDALGTWLKFSSEIYYKYLYRLIPYKIDNLRIRYLPDQQAKGYAAGIDLSLSGEFVKDLQSSFRLSLMKTAEDIQGDLYLQKDARENMYRAEPGFLRRPSDQRVNFSMFFQDRLPNNPAYKVHLSLLYGSPLPMGPPGTERYRDVFKIPAYKRVDIGFSKDFLDSQNIRQSAFLKKYFKSLIAYAEIFNLLDIRNTVSYLWVKDVADNQYAIPNYLSSRQLNLRIIAVMKYK